MKDKELAELLGIKSKWVLNYFCDDTMQIKKSVNDTKEQAIERFNDELYPRDEIKEEYPDFTEPENFVKLLNIVYKCGINSKLDFHLASMSFVEDNISPGSYLNDNALSTFEKVWLFCFKGTLGHPKDKWERDYIDLIKQAAQQVDWRY